jgi:hypothetical protein
MELQSFCIDSKNHDSLSVKNTTASDPCFGHGSWKLIQCQEWIHSKTTTITRSQSEFYKLTRCLHWLLTNWFNACIGSIRSDSMPAFGDIELTQCMHYISLNWFNVCIRSAETFSMPALDQFELLNACIGSLQTDSVPTLDQFGLMQCLH